MVVPKLNRSAQAPADGDEVALLRHFVGVWVVDVDSHVKIDDFEETHELALRVVLLVEPQLLPKRQPVSGLAIGHEDLHDLGRVVEQLKLLVGFDCRLGVLF